MEHKTSTYTKKVCSLWSTLRRAGNVRGGATRGDAIKIGLLCLDVYIPPFARKAFYLSLTRPSTIEQTRYSSTHFTYPYPFHFSTTRFTNETMQSAVATTTTFTHRQRTDASGHNRHHNHGPASTRVDALQLVAQPTEVRLHFFGSNLVLS